MAIVDASSVPEMPADPTALLAAAAAMSPAAASVGERTADAVTRWSTLGDAFDTPDTSTAIGRAQPLVVIADDFEEAASAVADAIRTLAETLAALAWTQAQLAEDVDTHVADVARYQASEAGQDEAARGILDGMGLSGWTQNESLRQRCAHLRAQFQAALLVCEQDLGRIGDPAVTLPAAAPAASTSLGERATVFADTVSMSVLQRLASALPGDVEKLLSEHPDWSALVREHPPAPNVVDEWWKSLDAATVAALISGASPLIGNLEGISYVSRDQANRKTLEREIAKLRADLKAVNERPTAAWEPGYGVGGGKAAETLRLESKLNVLLNIDASLASPRGRAARYLAVLTNDEPPLAAVAIGSVDVAASVTFAVPGMGTTTKDMTGWADAAQNIFDEQARESHSNDRAVVAWIGYKTPPVPISQGWFDVMSTDDAATGAEALRDALNGVDQMRTAPVALNVVGHSYGTTTAAIALTLPGTARVESFVSVGSAGLPATISAASDINATGVFSGQARNVIPVLEDGSGDQWAWTGRSSTEHPIDPTDAAFGATTFGADGDNGDYPVTDHGALVQPGRGWGYLDRGTESLRNVARATTGQGDLVSPYVAKPPTAEQNYWRDVMYSPGFGL